MDPIQWCYFLIKTELIAKPVALKPGPAQGAILQVVVKIVEVGENRAEVRENRGRRWDDCVPGGGLGLVVDPPVQFICF